LPLLNSAAVVSLTTVWRSPSGVTSAARGWRSPVQFLLVALFFIIAKPFCMALFHRMVASNLAMRSAGLAVRAKAFKRELRICRARVHAHSLALFFSLLAPCVCSYTPSYLTKQLLVLHCLPCLACLPCLLLLLLRGSRTCSR
jgi:dolichyl-phosphate-mannose--protein O-mannosyl transferase